jgi:hypothetical protein
MTNEEKLGDVMSLLTDILKVRLADMKADPDKMNVSLLKEARELLKQHNIEMDPNSAPMQELKEQHDEIADWRKRHSS